MLCCNAISMLVYVHALALKEAQYVRSVLKALMFILSISLGQCCS